MFTSFKPDLEMKSIKSLISEVFIEAGFELESVVARAGDSSFLAAGFDARDLLMKLNLFYTFNIFTGAGVDLNFIACVNKKGNADFCTVL